MQWNINQAMTMASIPGIELQYRGELPKKDAWSIDCHQVDHTDSAGVAWLLLCVKHAAQHKIALEIKGLSASTCALIDAHGLASLFSSYCKGLADG